MDELLYLPKYAGQSCLHSSCTFNLCEKLISKGLHPLRSCEQNSHFKRNLVQNGNESSFIK